MFSKILIANRGEVAVRIIRACKEMGISTVAIYSTADEESLHTSMADTSICVGGPTPQDSYLNQNRIISAALVTGAQAIHPGYGFLAENHEFAALCKKYGIVFIGPKPDVIEKLGDKDNARKIMKSAGVTISPGSSALSCLKDAEKWAEKIGFPLLIKAKAGGGGKGIRLVNNNSEVKEAFMTAKTEAENAFGDGGLYMERYLNPVKHIEVQILADESGNVISLGERECSIQKNNQKLIEESPSSAISPEMRDKMIKAAVKAAKAVGYTNAGTVEFLVDSNMDFYFMEMNTRLQVEHPVTESVTRVDIVKWQIRIADGIPLDFKQKDIQLAGASIECRINAKSSGEVNVLNVPGGPWVRFDSALYQSYIVPPYYDSMVGKLIVYANTREEAIRKMNAALGEIVIEGVETNIDDQIAIIHSDQFRSGNYYTNFVL